MVKNEDTMMKIDIEFYNAALFTFCVQLCDMKVNKYYAPLETNRQIMTV